MPTPTKPLGRFRTIYSIGKLWLKNEKNNHEKRFVLYNYVWVNPWLFSCAFRFKCAEIKDTFRNDISTYIFHPQLVNSIDWKASLLLLPYYWPLRCFLWSNLLWQIKTTTQLVYIDRYNASTFICIVLQRGRGNEATAASSVGVTYQTSQIWKKSCLRKFKRG